MFIAKLYRSRKAATAIEYGLIAALIALAAVGAISQLGSGSTGMFKGVEDKVTDAMS
ncbi:Flp family type IVb pilin [Allosphingosinicella vermicomposti]|uniref:Flp family type IVb pilin n=1 Tax=Allosphingosinicella vermicomposti TaxID=614671 RepID=UPI000D107672|nr:Flp family type IVb pilin [Allosphingosinicella vermicomposti]